MLIFLGICIWALLGGEGERDGGYSSVCLTSFSSLFWAYSLQDIENQGEKMSYLLVRMVRCLWSSLLDEVLSVQMIYIYF